MNVQKMFDELGELGLRQEEFPENMSWDEYVASMDKLADEDKELKKLIELKANEELIDGVTLEEIMTSNFTNAKATIDQMTLVKRIEILEDLYKYRDYLYQVVGNWGKEGAPKKDQMSVNDYMALMGRIKHLEILQNWLYGIL